MQKTNRLLEQASELASLEEFDEAFRIYAVSYTHLTLPTIYSV